MGLQNGNRERAVAAMALLDEDGDASMLVNFLGDEDAEAISSIIDEYSKEKNLSNRMKQTLRHLASSENFSSLADVHPAWILEHLKNEPPRVVGIILRFLPSRHVRYLLKNLPPMLCEQIPNMVESFSVEPAVLETIRRSFERHFPPMRISRSIKELGFENLYYLKEFELEEVFKELGLMELAVALSGMTSKVLTIIYNRLNVKEAKRLKAAIDDIENISPELYCEARSNFLAIDSEGLGPDRLLKSVGIAVFAGAISDEDADQMTLIQQKLSPNLGYLLKRLVDEKKLKASAISSTSRKSMVLEVVKKLAKEGRIDDAWGGYEAHEDAPSSSEDLLPEDRFADENTSTLSQLA